MISSWLGTGVVATTFPSRLEFSKAEDLRVSHWPDSSLQEHDSASMNQTGCSLHLWATPELAGPKILSQVWPAQKE